MEISHPFKKLSYLFLNPNHTLYYSWIFRAFFSTSKVLISPIKHNTLNPNTHFTSSLPIPTRLLSRPLSSTSSSIPFQPKRFNFSNPKLMRKSSNGNTREIVEVIKRDEANMENELSKLGLILTIDLVNEIFWGLNTNGVSGLRFFNWVREKQVPFYRNSNFCSLAVDNLGRVGDYDSMFCLLKGFSEERLCLTEKAFAFLPVFSSDNGLIKDNVRRVLEMLNKVGGSSRNSGIFALIKMLCTLSLFDLAVLVMEETARTTSYYNVLIWAKCKSCDFQEAYDLYDEMKSFGCDPNANSYNYLLGSLCKNDRNVEACRLFGKMQEFGYVPDAITFEVIICRACRIGRLDFAVEFLNLMMSRGIEPRRTTHAAMIKGYFYGNRFQEAYKYVVDMCDKCKGSGTMNYSLFASLLQKSRRAVEARDILVDMMGKGLKPNFPVYMKVMKDLHDSGMGYLVGDLKVGFPNSVSYKGCLISSEFCVTSRDAHFPNLYHRLRRRTQL